MVTTPAIGSADTRLYLYDLDHRIVGEYGATGTADIKAEYIWLMPEVGATGPTGGDDGLGGYMPLATAVGQTGALNWLHTHHHGAPILTTNAAGTIVPYPAHAVLGFPGQFANSQQLAGAQHYYNRYRDYDVNTGRYIQADPIGLAGDDNPYAYAGGNPLGFMDPDGLDSWHVTFNDQPIRRYGMTVARGHSANIAVNETTGATRYREFGAYQGTNGMVKSRGVGDLAISGGVPTYQSVAGLVRNIVEIGGRAESQNITITITLGTPFDAQMAYADMIAANPPSWSVWYNCHTFAGTMAKQGRRFGARSKRFRINPRDQRAAVNQILKFYQANAPFGTPPQATPQKPDWILK